LNKFVQFGLGNNLSFNTFYVFAQFDLQKEHVIACQSEKNLHWYDFLGCWIYENYVVFCNK